MTGQRAITGIRSLLTIHRGYTTCRSPTERAALQTAEIARQMAMTDAARKTRTISKEARKTSLRAAPPKKRRQGDSGQAYADPARGPDAPEERIGVVNSLFAAIQLERGTLRVSDVIHICRHTTDFRQKVESLEVDHAPTTEVRPKDDFNHAREHDFVFKVRS